MEKTLLKIAGVIAIIIGALCCIGIITAIIGIPLIIGGVRMKDYANLSGEEFMEKRNSVLGWSIFFLFFTFISGVLGIIAYVYMENQSNEKPKSSFAEEIKDLDRLRKNGLISEAEYEAKKKKILDI